MAQFSRPTVDVSTGGWTTAPLWSKLDDNSDADFVDGPGTGAAFTCASGTVTDPVVATGYILRIRVRRFGGSVPSGDYCGIKHELLEGATVRASHQYVFVSNSALETKTYTLSSAEANAIGNHANLRHRVTELIPEDSTDAPRVAWVELEVPTPAVPAKVTGVNATDGTRADDSRITYNAAAGASSYDIWRHTSNSFGAATKIKSNNGGTSYLDTGAGQGVANKRWYWVVATNAAGDATESSPDTGYKMGLPSTPTGLAASDSTSEDYVEITCSGPSTGDGTVTHKLYRDGALIASVIAAFPYLDTTAVPGTTYAYTATGSNAAGDSSASTADNGTRAVGTPPVSTAPTGYTATSGAFQGKIRHAWTEYADATEMRLYRALVAIKPAAPYVTGILGTSYEDTAVAPGQTYYHWLSAVVDDVETDAAGPVTGSAAVNSLRFFQPALKAMIDLGVLGTASVADLSATPTVEFEVLGAEYEFGPTDSEYSAIPAGAKRGVTHSYDGTDADQMTARLGRLNLADAALEVAAGADPARQLLVWSDHDTTWQPLVCIQDSFVGSPFELRGGDAPTIEWSRLLGGLFRLGSDPGLGSLYPYFAEQMLYALLGGSARHELPSAAPTLKINLLASPAKLALHHRYLDDIADDWFAISESAAVTIASVATANVGTTGVRVTATNPVFTAPAASNPDATHALVYLHDADPKAAILALLLELPEPIEFDGTDVTLDVNTAASGLWQWGD